MIKTEEYAIGTMNFVKHYSDLGFKIRQVETGILYDEANDVVPCRYTYEETDVPENQEEENLEEEEAQETE